MSMQPWADMHDWLALAGAEAVGSIYLDGMVKDILHNKQQSDRQMRLIGAVNAAQGDVVALSSAGTGIDKVALTTTSGQLGMLGIAMQPMTAAAAPNGGAAAWVRWSGWALVNVASATAPLDYLRASASTGKAEPCLATDAGAFAIASSSTAGVGQVSALLLPSGAGGGGGGAGGGNDLWDALAVATVPALANFPTTDHLITGPPATTFTLQGSRLEILTPGAASARVEAVLRPWNNASTQIFTVALRPRMPGQGNYEFGLALRDSATDARKQLRIYHDLGRWVLQDINQTNFNTFGAGGGSTYLPPTWGALWLQAERGATNRILRYCFDGTNWVDYLTTSNTDYVTPDQVGVYVNCNGTAQKGVLEIRSFTHV